MNVDCRRADSNAANLARPFAGHSAQSLSSAFCWRGPPTHVDWGLNFSKPIFAMHNGCSHAWGVTCHVFYAPAGSLIDGNVGAACKHNQLARIDGAQANVSIPMGCRKLSDKRASTIFNAHVCLLVVIAHTFTLEWPSASKMASASSMPGSVSMMSSTGSIGAMRKLKSNRGALL